MCLAPRGIELGIGSFQLPQDVVTQMDRIGEVLEAERVRGEAGNGERPGDGAERQHEVLPGDVERARLRRLDVCGSPLRVDRGHAAEQQLGVRAHLAQRHDDVPRLERPGRGLGKERRVEHEVLRADDRCAAAAEQSRDVAAGEAASGNEHSATCRSRRLHPGDSYHGTPFSNDEEQRLPMVEALLDE